MCFFLSILLIFHFYRIRTRLSNFDYKSTKFDEDQLDDGCDKKICVCSKKNGEYCDKDAEDVCFPSVTNAGASRAHHKGSGIGKNSCAWMPL